MSSIVAGRTSTHVRPPPQDLPVCTGWQKYPQDPLRSNPARTPAHILNDRLTAMGPALFCDQLKVTAVDIRSNNGIFPRHFVLRNSQSSITNCTGDPQCNTMIYEHDSDMTSMLAQTMESLPRIRIL